MKSNHVCFLPSFFMTTALLSLFFMIPTSRLSPYHLSPRRGGGECRIVGLSHSVCNMTRLERPESRVQARVTSCETRGGAGCNILSCYPSNRVSPGSSVGIATGCGYFLGMGNISAWEA
jgi:hypothetical protein